MSNNYIVKPVYKALQVLQCLGQEGRELGLTEICHRVQLPKTTVFRYLYTLERCGFVAHNPETDLYRLGLRVFELGQLAGDQLQLRELARPFMQKLRDRFNETVNLGILDNEEIVYVDMIESHHSLRMRATLGSRDPVYSTALGKAMLAFMPEAQRKEHVPSQLAARTPNTVTSLATLEAELERTRQRGFSFDDEENENGARCIGAPIFDHTGRVAAAVSVSGPSSRFSEDLQPAIADGVIETAAAISQKLGFDSDGG